jgi:hypothetical protein
MVYDAGRASCGDWIARRAARNDNGDMGFIQLREWTSGFITAYNWYTHHCILDGSRGNVCVAR